MAGLDPDEGCLRDRRITKAGGPQILFFRSFITSLWRDFVIEKALLPVVLGMQRFFCG